MRKTTEETLSLLLPDRQSCAVVLASPHSGQIYPEELLRQCQLEMSDLRKLEDCFVDELWATAPDLGMPLLRAHFARAFIDVNRDALELDPDMFLSPLPVRALGETPRLKAGFGSIPRMTGHMQEIYRGKLAFPDALKRIDHYYRPYHTALEKLLGDTAGKFGNYLLLDCHSMPESVAPIARRNGKTADIILGDRFGASCGAAIMDFVESAFEKSGFAVMRNDPYAGGFITEYYGKPAEDKHVIQIEINRALYMDEKTYERNSSFDVLKQKLAEVLAFIRAVEFPKKSISPYPLAAE